MRTKKVEYHCSRRYPDCFVTELEEGSGNGMMTGVISKWDGKAIREKRMERSKGTNVDNIYR
jgi:hypothetical protein